MKFKLKAPYKPAGDQPKAIEQIIKNFEKNKNITTLLGATGTGKTFTMANVIQHFQKPTLIISHNKTLAAQLATEFKAFFPDNSVNFFVSYFDYYQPESYLPEQGIYIEKETTINKEIEMYRLATMASLLTRKDVIVVASVSSLYGLGQRDFFEKNSIKFEIGKKYTFKEIKKKLLELQYKPIQSNIEAGKFDFRGDVLDIFSSTEKKLYRLHFDEEILEFIEERDSLTYETISTPKSIVIRPATQFLQNMDNLEKIFQEIQKEMEERYNFFVKQGKQLEAERIKKRVLYDIRMIKETGYVNGIENYSRYFDNRQPGQAPNTLFDYFPDDFLFIIDESHMSIPQLKAMPKGDFSRKTNLVNHGFRLPSALDHRPLNFEELEIYLGWKKPGENNLDPKNLKFISNKIKKNAKTLFSSATPGTYELEISFDIIEQIIRPTGLLDPITYVYPKSGDTNLLTKSLENLLQKKPYLEKFLKNYESDNLKEIFE